VNDGEGGWGYQEFTLKVIKDTVEPLLPPKLSSPKMSPTSGNIETVFTFTVDYNHPEGDLPDSIQVVIDGNAYNLESTNGHYEYSTKLSEGNHTYSFITKLGEFTVNTSTYNTGHINKVEDQPIDGDEKDDVEDNTMLYTGIGIIFLIIVILILLFIFLKKRGKKEELQAEEAQSQQPEDVASEQVPITDVSADQFSMVSIPSTEQSQILETPQMTEQPSQQIPLTEIEE
jgi:flagellar biosynthesis/type III secretory pathway M-ring protein FliF/YscJ